VALCHHLGDLLSGETYLIVGGDDVVGCMSPSCSDRRTCDNQSPVFPGHGLPKRKQAWPLRPFIGNARPSQISPNSILLSKMARAQSDEVGVTELHAPDNPAVDICFVHGLGGGSLSTWTSGEICWPRDLLKDDIPDARILAFGYESKVAQLQSKVSHNSFEQHAVNLSGNLGRSRIGETAVRIPKWLLNPRVALLNLILVVQKKRPLIFVAHSLGGLICVKVL